ncbi:MAG TPA: rhodanese-like domain-containing protein [Holophagaceae bacterium]|nr:rhodanese-like domain-containing protein [Holophagaceae bacterium]
MKRFLIPFLALPLLALLGAWTGNALASSRRRLAWLPTRVAPPPPDLPPAAPASEPLPSRLRTPAPPPADAVAKPVIRAVPAPAAPSPPPPEEVAQRFPFNPDRLERGISSDEAFEAFRLGLAFFDARRSEEFEAGHIPGAHSVPVWEDGLPARLATLAGRPGFPPRKARLTTPIVVYCSGGACEDSHLLAEQLIPLGFGTILIYQDGFPDWQGKHRPVARGPETP